MKINLTKGCKRLLCIMPVMALAIVASGYLYFQSVNRSEDPRILPARNNFAQYNRLMRDNRFSAALSLLDDIEAIYQGTPGYRDAFELGVIENNRASVYLVQAETERLSSGQIPVELIENDLNMARKHILAAIGIYKVWMRSHESLGRQQIEQLLSPHFTTDDLALAGARVQRVIAKRVNDIAAAIEEMPRRLSVTYTNLGVIARYQGHPDVARQHYEKAISLWQHNNVARNNLNVLLGKPTENRSFFEKLFPPSKKLS